MPGTIAKFLWVCLSMLLLLLWGPLRASLSPHCYLFVSLGVSGSVCPCVFLASFLCRAVLLSPFLGICLCPFDTAGQSGFLYGPWSALGPTSCPDLPCLSLHSLRDSPPAGWFPQSHF